MYLPVAEGPSVDQHEVDVIEFRQNPVPRRVALLLGEVQCQIEGARVVDSAVEGHVEGVVEELGAWCEGCSVQRPRRRPQDVRLFR